MKSKKETEILVSRSISISTLNTSIEVKSDSPRDSLEKLKKIATELADKYSKQGGVI